MEQRNTQRKRGSRICCRMEAGFSLVEVVLALGIFAFCIVVILGLVPGMMTQSKESWQETRSAHIARQIVSDLASGKDATGFLIEGGPPSSAHAREVSLVTTGTYEATYDRDGNPVPAASKDAGFRARLTIEPDATRNGLSAVAVQVRQADASPDSDGFQFFTKVASLTMTNSMTP